MLATFSDHLHDQTPGQNLAAPSSSSLEESPPNRTPRYPIFAWTANHVGKLESEREPSHAVIDPTPELTVGPAPQARPTKESAQQSAPNVGEPTKEKVQLTFYYCDRTVEMPDDGGGYCGTTATGTTVHPGTAACPAAWLGRSFTIVGDTSSLVYTCEDTGNLVAGNQVDIWFQINGEGWSWPLAGEGEVVWR